MSNHIDRITIDPDVCYGKPVVRALPITVETLDYLSAGETAGEILRQHPMLERGTSRVPGVCQPLDEPQVQRQRDGVR
jgi:uncharacterized protein (DUF433 family)